MYICIYLYSASINALLYVLGEIKISGDVKLAKGNSQFTLTCTVVVFVVAYPALIL